MGQFHFTPDEYLETIHEAVPRYAELQDRTAEATRRVAAREILELGVGTGETARHVLAIHPRARLVAVDESPPMLARAREALPDALLVVGRLQDPLPPQRFDLVVSALAVHHLTRAEKRDLFRRIAAVIGVGGLFVLADVVVPERAEDVTTPIEAGYDLPDPLDDQMLWLREAGFDPEVVWAEHDLAVVAATRL
jgi:tRNA (cmo5U34)-methyltransferase